MKSEILEQKKVSDIIKSGWIEELSEEEEKVLKHGARIDKLIKENKKIKIDNFDQVIL